MMKIEERFSENTIREWIGTYILIINDYGTSTVKPIIPITKNELTTENFAMLHDVVLYTINDFKWYGEDGLDLDFFVSMIVNFLLIAIVYLMKFFVY